MTTFGPYRGVVDSVHDGDTVNVKLDVGFDLTVYTRVRILGINAPELSTAEGKRARDYAQTLLAPGSDVMVISHGWDKYGGRIDGEVQFRTAGIFVDFATTMLNAGQAKPYDGGPR
jgi:endonuclease YncB( thermonuclease family)